MSAWKNLDKRVNWVKTEELLERVLHFAPARVDSVYSQLVAKNEYDGVAKRWTCFGPPGAVNDPQGSFVRVANAIHEAARNHARDVDIKTEIEMCWMDTRSSASRPEEGTTSPLRPHVVPVLGKAEEMEAWEKVVKADALVKQKETPQEKTKAEASDPWWLRVHSAVEVTAGKREEDICDAVTQLGKYIDQIFLTQLDRCFVLGLVLCSSHLFVWLCDRSGFWGTHTSINIHEDPRTFISIITSFSLLPPYRLGWDLTMELYLRPYHYRTEPLRAHSYEPAVTPEYYHALISYPHWIFEMPTEYSYTQPYITVDLISMDLSEMTCGRVRLIWRVVNFDDYCRKGPSVASGHARLPVVTLVRNDRVFYTKITYGDYHQARAAMFSLP